MTQDAGVLTGAPIPQEVRITVGVPVVQCLFSETEHRDVPRRRPLRSGAPLPLSGVTRARGGDGPVVLRGHLPVPPPPAAEAVRVGRRCIDDWGRRIRWSRGFGVSTRRRDRWRGGGSCFLGIPFGGLEELQSAKHRTRGAKGRPTAEGLWDRPKAIRRSPVRGPGGCMKGKIFAGGQDHLHGIQGQPSALLFVRGAGRRCTDSSGRLHWEGSCRGG